MRRTQGNPHGHSRRVNAFQTLAISAAMLFISLQWAHTRLQRPSPLELTLNALFYDLTVWICAAALTSCIYLGVSLADFADLVRAALRASAPAMWLVPAILLLSVRTPVAALIGLLLVANTVRLLVSTRAPQGCVPIPPPKPHTHRVRMFRSADVRPATFGDRLPPLAGAIALQAGVWTICAGYRWLSAACFALCAAVWTWSSKKRGALQPRETSGPWHSLLSIVATLLLTIALSLAYLGTDRSEPATAGLLETPRQVLYRLTHEPKPTPKLQAQKKQVTPLSAPVKPVGASVPGVILRSEAAESKLRRRVWGGPPLSATPLPVSQPLTIPFTGEYHLFRASSSRLPPDSITDRGTPLDTLYATTNGEPMQMEAIQALTPPIDLSKCGRIQIAIASRETEPGIVLLEFLTADTVEEGGIALFALNGAAEETINFTIPPKSVRFPIGAIRVIFQHSPAHNERNSRIAIQRFTLSPTL